MYAIRSYYGSILNVEVPGSIKVVVNGKLPYGSFVEIEGENAEVIQTVAGKLNLKWNAAVITSYSIHYTKLYDCWMCSI